MVNDEAQRIYDHIGHRIHELRKSNKPKPMSQKALADAVGLSRASLANIESGRHRIQIHILYALARALDANIMDILPPPSMAYAGVDELPREFLDQLRPKERASISKLVRKQ